MYKRQAVIGPLSIALRPWPALKDVSARMISNVATLSLTPALTAASMSLALHTVNDSGVLGISQAIGGLAGMVVSILMPAMVSRFLPLGGSGDSGGRALIAAAATTAATVAALGATGSSAVIAAAGHGGGTSQLASFMGGGGPPTPDSSSGRDHPAGTTDSRGPGIASQAPAPEPPKPSGGPTQFDGDPTSATGPGGDGEPARVAARISEMLSTDGQ